MFRSSNINVMSNSILKAAKVLRRDFGELELQNSFSGIENFIENTVENTQEIIHSELSKAGPSWKYLVIKREKDIKDLVIEDYTFVVSILDGLDNFKKGISYFSTSITIVFKKKPIASVIYDPIKDELFFAENGKGAFLNNSRIRISSQSKITDALLVLENKDFFYSNLTKSLIKKYDPHVRVFGCSTLDLANISAGRYDILFTRKLDKFRDAGVLLLLQEAGGIILELSKENIDILSNNVLSEIIKLNEKDFN